MMQGQPAPSGASIHVPLESLAPLVESVVAAMLLRLEEARAKLDPSRIAYGEAEAARLLGLNSHQLRDERLRGRVSASVGPGKRILYSRANLLDYLASRRWSPREER